MLDGSRLYLKAPTINELDYRRELIADADSMSYNKGYGVNGTGCYIQTVDEVKDWYRTWVCAPQHYYAYIMLKADNKPIGEVCLQYDNETDTHAMGLIIQAIYRGKGYAEEAIKLLADKAFNDLGAKVISDTFSQDRTVADKVFTKVGFIRKDANLLILSKDDYNRTIEAN